MVLWSFPPPLKPPSQVPGASGSSNWLPASRSALARRRPAWHRPSRGPASAPCLLSLPAARPADTAFLDTQIELLDVVLLEQPGAGVLHDDAAHLQDIAVIGDVQGHVGVLLHEQDGHPSLAVDPEEY